MKSPGTIDVSADVSAVSSAVLSGVLSALVATCALACSSDGGTGVTVSFRVLGPVAMEGDGCPAAEDATRGPLAFPGAQPDRVRVTYLRAQTDPPAPADARFLCDAVFEYESDGPVVAVPSQEETEIVVEFFSPADELLAVGSASSADLGAGGAVEIDALLPGRFACAGDQMNLARALHSATTLPDGRVIIVGGLVADPGGLTNQVDVAAGLYMTSSIEIYDPVAGTFESVFLPGLTPRALHQARVHEVSPDGSVLLALYGGFTVADVAAPAVVPLEFNLRWAPTTDAISAPLELLRITAAGEVTLFGEEATAPNLLAAHVWLGNDRLARVGGQQVVIDPVTGAQTIAPYARFSIVDASTWEEEASNLPTIIGRQGSTVTALDESTALVWGGHTNSLQGELTAMTAELLIGLDRGGLPEARQIPISGTPVARAMHGAALVNGDLLVVGGFDFSTGVFNLPADPFVERVSQVAGGIETVPVLLEDGSAPVPAGYVSTLGLASGDVLVSGGNPDAGHGGCSAAQGGVYCSLNESYVFRADELELIELSSPLLVSRYGHRMTELADGRVLVTGGLHTPATLAELSARADAEVVDPRRVDRDALPGLGRAPGALATGLDGAIRSECQVIESAALAE